MDAFSAPGVQLYPLVFFDGEQEHHKGAIAVHPGLGFPQFQQQVAQRVGLNPGHLVTVVVCSRAGAAASDIKQQIPVHEHTNFRVILNQHNPVRDKAVHFLVSLKHNSQYRAAAVRRKALSVSSSESGDSSPEERAALAALPARALADYDPHRAALLQHLARAAVQNAKAQAGRAPGSWLGAGQRPLAAGQAGGGGWPPQHLAQRGAPSSGLMGGLMAGVPLSLASGLAMMGAGLHAQPAWPSKPANGFHGNGAGGHAALASQLVGHLLPPSMATGGGGGGLAPAIFWRTSARDRVVARFRGPSPFGPIGKSGPL